MSITVTYTTLTTPINAAVTDISAADSEALINTAVDTLNIFGLGITRLTGSSESMTATWTSQQLGAVTAVFRILYASYYNNAANTNNTLGPSSVSTADLMSNPTAWAMIQQIASELKGITARASPPIYISNPPIT